MAAAARPRRRRCAGAAVLTTLAVAVATPALAADRAVTVTDFDRVTVDGSYAVDIVTGPGASARVGGTADAIEAVSVAVQGRTLVVRRSVSAWGGYPGHSATPVHVRLTTPILQSLRVAGSAAVTVDRMRGPRLAVALEGSGALTVAQASGDALDIALSGAGRIMLAGTVATVTLLTRGSGEIDAAHLIAADARLRSDSAGTTTMTARRSAQVVAAGSGSVTVLGSPACTVSATGSGTVACGKAPPR